ncbi:MAG: DNA-directed DNA polymerase I [Candidatus Bathyarchaeia archaeon]
MKEELLFKPEAPKVLTPSYLVSARFDGERETAYLKLYEPKSQRIFFWYDDGGHHPYLLCDSTPEELRRIPRIASHPGLLGFERVTKHDPLTEEEVEVTKILLRDPLSVGGRRGCVRDILREEGIKTWEDRIRYHLSYIFDRQLIPGMLYEVKNGDLVPVERKPSGEAIDELGKLGEGEHPELKDHMLRWATLLECPFPEFKRVALDIEVYTPEAGHVPSPKEADHPVICVSLIGSDGLRRVLLLRRPNVLEGEERLPAGVKVEYFDAEERLIEEVFHVLLRYPFVITFNGDEFDLPYLHSRALKLGFKRQEIPIIIGRSGERGTAFLSYGIHLDLYRLFFNRALKTHAFKDAYRETSLDDIGAAILGIRKLEHGVLVSDLSYSELARYCFRDTEITYGLTAYDDEIVMKLATVLARIAHMPIEDLSRLGVSKWIQNVMQYEHRARDMLIPQQEDIHRAKGEATTKAIIKGKKYKGAIVVDPKPGVHFDVAVLDFSSLYPSAIKRWGLSYETVRCRHKGCEKNIVPGTPHWVCKRGYGLTAIVIGSLRDLRVRRYKPRSKDHRIPKEQRDWYEVIEKSLKVILNASYGVFGAESFPFYCPPVAECTAAVGRHLITQTIKKAEEIGIEVVYGDTDSVFLESPKEEQTRRLIGWVRDRYRMDLDVDKVYRFVVFSTRKKNYVGVYPDGVVDVKGLTGKKRNIPPFLKNAFAQTMKVLSGIKSEDDFMNARMEIEKIVQSSYSRLKRHEYPVRDLAISVMLGKIPERYTKTTPQHVKAVNQLIRKGAEARVGDIVSFVKVRGKEGVKPVQLASADEIDVPKYVELMRGTFEQVLDPIDINFEELIGIRTLDAFLRGE